MKIRIYLIFVLFFLISWPLYSQDRSYKNAVGAGYQHVFLEGSRSDWNLGQLEYKRMFPKLTSLLRVRYANRFEQSAYFSELDLYPVFSEKSYGYFSFGTALSGQELFPDLQLRGTVYRNLTETLVGGVGMRYQSYNIDDVLIYNADLHWYIKDYLFMGQSLFQFQSQKLFATFILTARKYLSDSSYLATKFAIGQAPQTLLLSEDVLNTYKSYLIGLEGNFHLEPHFVLRSGINFRKSRYSSATSRYRIGTSVGITYRF